MVVTEAGTEKSSKRGFLRNNSLSLVCFGLFAIFLMGQFFTGFRNYNEEQTSHKQPEVSLGEYTTSGAFWEALSENWESEYLQMASYVILTAFLIQKGSAESKDPDKGVDEADRDPQHVDKHGDVPWPVRRGGLWLRLYENSLFVVFLLLFITSMVIHAFSGARAYSSEQAAHGEPRVSAIEYVQRSRFWFESFQNWQSEFLAVGSIVVFSVWLRQRGSPESKPVDAPHTKTA